MSAMGMWILIASLSVLFFASLVAFLFIHFFRGAARTEPLPELPSGMWISTALLLLSSASLHWALLSARRDQQQGVRTAMVATLLLGLGFLANQALNWTQMHSAGVQMQGFYAVSFYFLTALHAAHVIGGVVPIATVTAAAFRGYYTHASHIGLRLLGMYWHFLDIVWLVLFGVLALALR
ncbi:MAG: cytochrome c oxidase subunit 3 [bacterium]|nr:cytochrome c oxidase subunit 3 [bacterium]